MCRRGPDHIARTTRHLGAKARAEYDIRELTTGMTAGPKRHGRRPAVARRPPALADAKGGASQFVAEVTHCRTTYFVGTNIQATTVKKAAQLAT
jgi:hypothetical protein